jgi:hypothetical protein
VAQIANMCTLNQLGSLTSVCCRTVEGSASALLGSTNKSPSAAHPNESKAEKWYSVPLRIRATDVPLATDAFHKSREPSRPIPTLHPAPALCPTSAVSGQHWLPNNTGHAPRNPPSSGSAAPSPGPPETAIDGHVEQPCRSQLIANEDVLDAAAVGPYSSAARCGPASSLRTPCERITRRVLTSIDVPTDFPTESMCPHGDAPADSRF